MNAEIWVLPWKTCTRLLAYGFESFICQQDATSKHSKIVSFVVVVFLNARLANTVANNLVVQTTATSCLRLSLNHTATV